LRKLHFILDYETIGQDVFKAPVVNCAYYLFDWERFTSDNPYTFQELIGEIRQDKFKIREQIEDGGYSYKRDDLEFWKQNPIAYEQLRPTPQDISVEDFTTRLYDYVIGNKVVRWWSRSNTFDPILLHRNFLDFSSREKLDFILPYWLVRDIRTYIDTQFQFQNKKNGFCPIDDEGEWNRIFVAHNSIHDVAADILRIQKIERAIHL
jgi:hypothetical protein